MGKVMSYEFRDTVYSVFCSFFSVNLSVFYFIVGGAFIFLCFGRFVES